MSRHAATSRRTRHWLLSGRRASAVAAATLLAVVTVDVSVLVVHHAGTGTDALPPTPPRPAATSIGRSTTGPPTSRIHAPPIRCRRGTSSPLGGVDPSRVCIPAIRVDASVMQLGLNADRTVQVPPLSRVRDAGWYKYSATAGAVGPTVILGHVDSAQYGSGVFFRLGQLRDGDRVVIARADGKVATFRIDRVVEVAKRAFPTQAVYGPTSGPALRLITCGGRFDSATGNYVDNIIAFGSLQTLASS